MVKAARKRKGNPINGVLLLDKPIEMSSNNVIQKIKWLYQAQKVGHTGALDPLATGMLPICFGEATKFAHYLLDSDKRYRVVAQLGIRTNTSDAEGQVISEKEVMVSLDQINSALDDFRGDILQVPTMFSALKYQGKPLYEYARKGITIEREGRPITIYENIICHYDALTAQLELEIHCSKGTYIRTIIDDLGETLQCGAHVIALRRLNVATYPAEKMVTLEQLIEEHANQDQVALLSHLMATDSPIEDFLQIQMTLSQKDNLLLGRAAHLDLNQLELIALFRNKAKTPETLFRLYFENEFLGLGYESENKIHPKRLIAIVD